MKTISFKSFIFFVLPLFILGCGNNELGYNKKHIQNKVEVKDTILTDDVIEELRSNMWDRIELVFFDKNNNIIDGINKEKDTFFLKVHYKSLKFHSLNNNHEIFINSLSDNCMIDKVGDKFRLIINSGSYVDTVEYEVYLESSKHIFESLNQVNKKSQFSNKIRLATFYETFSLRKN